MPLLKQENVEIINDRVPLALTLDTSPLAGVKILVVDDEPDMRELMLTILESSGAEVRITASAAEALAEIDSFNPNMLISDIGMPEMDGYMLMRQVRQRDPQAGGNMMAIALTAYAGEIDQQQALAAGFQRHIAKPVDPVELVQIISNMLLPSH